MVIEGIKKVINDYKSQKDLSIDKLAYKIGVSKKTMQRIIDTENVSKLDTFLRLQKELNINLFELIIDVNDLEKPIIREKPKTEIQLLEENNNLLRELITILSNN